MSRSSTAPQQRRQAILSAAEELFLQQGFENTQVSQIVKQIGAAQGTFYNYFSSKEAALTVIFENIWEQFLQNVAACTPPGPPVSRLQFTLASLFQPPEVNPMPSERWQALTRLIEHPLAHQLFDQARMQALQPRILNIIQDGIADGSFQPYTFTPESVEILFMGINTYLHEHADEFSDPTALVRHITAIQEVLSRSLGLPPGSIQLISVQSR